MQIRRETKAVKAYFSSFVCLNFTMALYKMVKLISVVWDVALKKYQANHCRQSNNYTCAFCVQHTNESSCPKSVLRVRDYRGSLIKRLPAGRGRPLRGREKFALGDSKPIIILSPQALLLNWKLQTRVFLKRDIHVEISGTACSHFRPLLSTISSVLSTPPLLCRHLV